MLKTLAQDSTDQLSPFYLCERTDSLSLSLSPPPRPRVLAFPGQNRKPARRVEEFRRSDHRVPSGSEEKVRMDSAPSPDVSDAKPSFRKPANDAANRKYRRHSSTDMSDSSSSDGSPKVERNHSPDFSKDCLKMDVNKRKNDNKGSEKQAPVSYRDYHRHNEQSRHQRDAVEEERHYRKSSQSALESRSGNRFEHSRHESYQNRARESNYSVDKYSRDKSDIDRHSRDKSDVGRYFRDKSDSRTHRSKETMEYHRHNDRHLSDRAVSGGRYEVSSKDDIRSRERDWHRDRGDRDEKRERPRNLGDYKNDRKMYHEGEGAKGHAKDSRVGRDDSAVYRKETCLSSNKEMDETLEHKKKNDDRDSDKRKDRHGGVQDEEIQNEAKGLSAFYDKDGKAEWNKDKFPDAVDQPSTKKHKSGNLEKPTDEGVKRPEKETAASVNSEAVGSSSSQAEANQDFNAAKVAAIKAAELVNRNLIGGGATGFLSTDQKKKLLWGNKKNNMVEESGNRWDLPLFTDRERQEKFNKLMGVKGDLKLESKPDDKDGTLRAEKQEQLQMDLEKQYTAGLRRRDGRTMPMFGCHCQQQVESPSLRNHHLILLVKVVSSSGTLVRAWAQQVGGSSAAVVCMQICGAKGLGGGE
ncbi:hypothetical protein Taro_046477, partial [Colocasia esculenta]|nr:hypothetical protein [Colocasia esculenta]